MTSWLPDPEKLHRPVYLSLAEEISRAVGDGRLAPGTRLPTHRALAEKLQISVQTVSRAYEELIRKGLLAGEVGRGTFVRALRGEPGTPFLPERLPEIIDLSILKPVTEAFHLERFKAAIARLATDLPPTLAFSFRPNTVFARHRPVAVSWLRQCGLETAARNVLITNGATAAMSIALLTALAPGQTVVTEEIGHHTLVPLCSYLGLRLDGLAIDGQGVLPEAFERACAEQKVGALFVHPDACSPTSAVMGADRRAELVSLARRHEVLIIENDAWGPLIDNRLPPLASLAPERTLYVTSFSKGVMPGLRTGFLVVPDRLIAAANNRQLVTNWTASGLLAEIATGWIEDGTAMELVRWQRQEVRRRQEIAARLLQGLPFLTQRESLQIWLQLPSAVSEGQFVAQARLHGVAIAPGASFVTGSRPLEGAVRIAVGSTSTADLTRALQTIVDLYRHEPEPMLIEI